MRPLRLCALLAAIAPSLPLAASSYSEVREFMHPGELRIEDVTLAQIVASPFAFERVRVRFRCIFAENGSIYDIAHTSFDPFSYGNLIVYDAQAALWDPQVRANPVMTLYISKDRRDATFLGDLKQYQLIDVTGEIASVFENQPYIYVQLIKPVTDDGALTENAIYHIEQGNDANALDASGVAAYDLAEDHYVAALKENLPIDDRIRVAYLRAKNLMDWSHYQACAQVLRDTLAITGKDHQLDTRLLASLHYLLAKSIAETGENATGPDERAALYGEAVGHARIAVDLDPQQGDAYAVLGITLAGLGQYDEARRQCEKAIRLRPANAEVRWYLGRILDQEGSFEEAIDALRKAIDLTPKDHRIHKAIGAVMLHRGLKGGPKASDDLIAAFHEYDIAIRLDPSDPETHYGSGLVLEAAAANVVRVPIGSSDEPATTAMAIERFRDALAVDPHFLPAHRALANRYRLDNDVTDAVAQMRQITEIEPEREENFFELGRYLVANQRKDQAYACYQACLAAHPTSTRALFQLGQLALDLGKYGEGVAWEERLLAIDPQQGAAWLTLARLKLALGLPKDARDAGQQALAFLADGPEKEAARTVLQQAQDAINAPEAPAPAPAPAPTAPAPAGTAPGSPASASPAPAPATGAQAPATAPGAAPATP